MVDSKWWLFEDASYINLEKNILFTLLGQIIETLRQQHNFSFLFLVFYICLGKYNFPRIDFSNQTIKILRERLKRPARSYTLTPVRRGQGEMIIYFNGYSWKNENKISKCKNWTEWTENKPKWTLLTKIDVRDVSPLISTSI